MSITTESKPTTVTNANAVNVPATVDMQRELLLSLRQGMLMLSKTNATPEQYRAWRLMIAAIEKFVGIEGK